MFDHRHYVPILKAKQGELNALADLDRPMRASLTPLLEIPPVTWDWDNDLPARSLVEHLETYPEKLARAWPGDEPLFLDTIYPEVDKSDHEPATLLFDLLAATSVRAIPVTGPSRNGQQQQAVAEIVARDRRGVAIRVQADDLDPLELPSALDELLDRLRCTPNEADLILDYEQVATDKVATVRAALVAVLVTLPTLTAWRTLTAAGGGFPLNLQELAGMTTTSIGRADWQVWTSLAPRRAELPRLPTFADYGVSSPELVELDPRIMDMSVNLRYTSDADWVVLKARSRKLHGHGQFNELCQTLVGRSEFRGASFSAGDTYIEACAHGRDGPGNASKWRQCATNHHLTQVATQLASMPGL